MQSPVNPESIRLGGKLGVAARIVVPGRRFAIGALVGGILDEFEIAFGILKLYD